MPFSSRMLAIRWQSFIFSEQKNCYIENMKNVSSFFRYTYSLAGTGSLAALVILLNLNSAFAQESTFLAGAEAKLKAEEIAEKAFDPAKNSSKDLPDYHSLKQRLVGLDENKPLPPWQSRNIVIIGAYNNIILAADEKEIASFNNFNNLRAQIQNVFAQLEKSENIKELFVESQTDETPLLIRVSNSAEETIKFGFSGGFLEGWLANSGSGKVTQYSNYDEIVFYMNATYLTRSGKITPPYITLAHELRHWWQHSQIRKLKNTMIYDAEHEVPGEKYLNADFHDDSLYWKDAREILENTKEKQLSPHSNSISDKEDDAHSFEKIVLGDLHLPLDLVPHKYHDYRAKIIVDDPIRPVRILRKLLPKK